VAKKDFKLLRPIAYKTRTKVHIVNKKGFFALKRRYGKRYGLIIGAMLCIAFFTVAPRFIWTVDIYGNDEVEKEAIEESLRHVGIYRGALKSRIPDGFTVKQTVLSENPELVWAWAYIKGTSAEVRVYEKDLPPVMVDRSEPCSIAASCDAYVESVRALNGKKLINGSGAVRAGDIIISGKVPVFKEGYPEEYMYTHAEGEIIAYTEKTESGVYRLEYEHREPTGNMSIKAYLDLFGKRINLYRNEDSGFESYDTDEFKHDFLGISFGGTKYKEVNIEYEPMSLEGALQLARDELEEKLAKRLCKNSQLLDEDLQYEYVSENEIKVKLRMSCKEDIGTQVPVETEEVGIDKQEN
jgi:similar to stage IV sporulation protein